MAAIVGQKGTLYGGVLGVYCDGFVKKTLEYDFLIINQYFSKKKT